LLAVLLELLAIPLEWLAVPLTTVSPLLAALALVDYTGVMRFFDKLKSFFGVKVELTDEFFDALTDILVEGDFGASLAVQTVDELRVRCKSAKVTEGAGARALLADILAEDIALAPPPAPPPPNTLSVLLLLGVNGVGKTTTAAKLAAAATKRHAKPLLAAADTFRAAAIEQLQLHGQRLSVRVVAQQQHGDAAATVFDALSAAIAGNYNPLIVDTAGRMHTKNALTEELKKIDRIIDRFQKPDSTQIAPRKYLVLDATTGANAFAQAETFSTAMHVDGVVLTKMDSTAKGGIVFSLAVKLHLPVVYVCTGERYDDIAPFDARAFVGEFLAE
jgi:fused signal recognition particle receptor